MQTVRLPATAVAAAADDAYVWCAAGGRLLGFAADGSGRFEVEAPAGLGSLAAAGGTLAAARDPGIVAWLDGSSGKVKAELPVGGEPVVVAGGGAVWVFDRAAGFARRLSGPGAFGEPIRLGSVERLAPEGDRLWWTATHDSFLREGDRAIDLRAGPGERGALVACAGSVWVSVNGALLRVAAWGGELGAPFAAPEGPVDFLTCASGILVGGSGRRGLFCLDPSIDADVRHLDVEVGGELAHLVATRAIAWAFSAGAPEAKLVSVRLGE